MSSLVHSSMPEYAVISVSTALHCERLVIAYPDERTLRDFLAAQSIVTLGYSSREEAEASIDHCAVADLPRRKFTQRLAAYSARSLKKFVSDHLLSKDKFTLARAQNSICNLLQHALVAAVVVFYSKNVFFAAVRALIAF